MATLLSTARRSINHWYVPMIIGVLFVILGFYVFSRPAETYVALAIVFGLVFLISGIFQLIFVISNHKNVDSWGWILVLAFIDLIIGGVLLANLEVSALTLPIYIAFVIIIRSVSAIAFAFDLRKYQVPGWGYLMTLGVVGLILGFIMLVSPVFGAMSVVVWTGLAFLIVGIADIVLAFRLRKLKGTLNAIPDELSARYDKIQNEINAALGIH